MRSVVSKCHLELLDFPMCIESMSKDIRSLDPPRTACCAPRNHTLVSQMCGHFGAQSANYCTWPIHWYMEPDSVDLLHFGDCEL